MSDVEALAEVLRAGEGAEWAIADDYVPLSEAVLASDWLAAYVAAERDRAVREALAALRDRLEALANLAAEHMGCSGCPTPWWLVNWLSDEASARTVEPMPDDREGGA